MPHTATEPLMDETPCGDHDADYGNEPPTPEETDPRPTGERRSLASDVTYRCAPCDRVEQRKPIHPNVGTDDDSARVAGWRIGSTPAKPRVLICPECSGVDEDYWDRQTLAVAYMAGIDAGNTAWTGAHT